MTETDHPVVSTPGKPTLYGAVASAVHRLQSGVTGTYDSPITRAQLARLRQAAGRTPEKDPLAWAVVLEQILPELDSSWNRDEPSTTEVAAYTALTLYALHQRSQSQPMHVKSNRSLGYAVAQLEKTTKSGSTKSRLDALVTASTQNATTYHLRSIVNMLNSHDIPLDYGRLAEDLRRLWNNRYPHDKEGVILRWGRDYARGLWGGSASHQSPTDNDLNS
ncbi:type I-E CRISPR-associated protein Cse2/CasB [Rothia sp. LK2588]|uniref:type I-E CRISPR-associated protein Cse2/CasB n=1 Tax=Rothia sp. LK2588 TaxID=3114369 RepID=UPI0034CD6320